VIEAAAAMVVHPLTTSVVREVSELAELRAEWHQLNESARAGCLFLSPEWLDPWWRLFGAGRELRIICVREGGKLIGLWPLFSERVRIGGVAVTRIAFLGDGATGCDYLDLLATPGREREVLDACLGALGDLSWDLCDLDGLWRESPTALQLAQRFPSSRKVISGHAGLGGPVLQVIRDGRLRFVCPHIPLTGTFEEYLATLGRRENLRRREKWLFRQPGVSIECARTPEETPAATERFLELHRARWAREGGSDGLADDRHEAFHRSVTRALADRGWLRLYTLFAARRPVASVYGVVHRGRFLYYQSGYDPNWASKSVGLVLLARTVSDACGEGLSDFDFLRGDEGYKAEWARGERWTIQVRLWRGARGRAARAALGASIFARETVKAALPRRALDAVRKTRRVLRASAPEGESRLQAAFRILQEP
jgi:CelD/BcsL family acetyltransferase involved in cellulose biosynthesis